VTGGGATGSAWLWYATRGTGAVALALLTASIALGALVATRPAGSRPPRRYALGALHRNVTLIAVALVAAHVVTSVADGFAPVGLLDGVVPFASPYRRVWLGLGTVACDLVLVLVATSLVRVRLGRRLWKGVHWLAYAAWPTAFVHALGTGSDARTGFVRGVAYAAAAVVAGALVLRLVRARGARTAWRVSAGLASAAVLAGIALWYAGGPARHGWARRAGTPARLLGGAPRARPRLASIAVVRPLRAPFAAAITGTIAESAPAPGRARVTITGRGRGGAAGAFRVDLSGRALASGVAMTASGVSFVPAGTRVVYTGSVASLDGTRVVARLRAPGGARLRLELNLQVDAEAGVVGGTMRGTPAVLR
jgi:DMSO/TMAO reductase YedYZ heme-binding membrane subunit